MAEEFHFVFGEAGPERVSRDVFVESMWPYQDTSPEWYAARMAHNILCLNPERWADKPELYAWLKKLLDILLKPELVEHYRRELLTPEELASVRREEADIEENGL
jgi:hypothetical protein